LGRVAAIILISSSCAWYCFKNGYLAEISQIELNIGSLQHTVLKTKHSFIAYKVWGMTV
jgi:hypothetical protein